MISGVSRGSGAELAQSLQLLMQTLQSSQSMAMDLSEKLLKAGVQEAVQDSQLGTIIDVMA